jgi:hypothetical protein
MMCFWINTKVDDMNIHSHQPVRGATCDRLYIGEVGELVVMT